jgi:hypothetical protein
MIVDLFSDLYRVAHDAVTTLLPGAHYSTRVMSLLPEAVPVYQGPEAQPVKELITV